MRYKVIGWTVWNGVKWYVRWTTRRRMKRLPSVRPLLGAGLVGVVAAGVYAASRRA